MALLRDGDSHDGILTGISTSSEKPPADDEVAAIGTVVDTVTAVIGTDGGLIEGDDWQISFPVGAVADNTEFLVRQVDAQDQLAPESEGLLLEVTAPVAEFDAPVEYRVWLPDQYSTEDSWAVMALLLDPETGAWQYETATIEMAGGRPQLVLETEHFSSRLFEWLSNLFEYKFPPESAEPLEMPYYSQGVTPNCLSAVLQMGAQSATYRPESEVHGFMGALGPAFFGQGQGNPRLRWGYATGSYLTQQTGTAAKRIYWMKFQQQIQVEYIQRQLAFQHRPVLLSSYTAGHALLLVGYPNRRSFYAHDPQQGTGKMYRTMSLEKLGLDETGNLTIVIPKAPADNRPLISVNLLDDSVNFEASTNQYYSFRWDVDSTNGYLIRANRPMPKGKVVDVIPKDASTVTAGRPSFTGIEVANAHRHGDPKTVALLIEVVGHGPAKTHYEERRTLTLQPATRQRVNFDSFSVGEFRDPSPQATRYTFKVTASVDGKECDQASFDFVLEPEMPPTPVPAVAPSGKPCVCPDGTALGLDYSLGCSSLLVAPMDPDWTSCYRGCIEACGCDPDDLDLTCACDCLGLAY
jgi:hypothetical protein